MLTVDLILHEKLRAEEEERKRREQEAKQRALGSVSNLLTLVGLDEVGTAIADVKNQAGLIALDRAYNDINSQAPMSRETFADFLTEYTDPGHLQGTFRTATQTGILDDPTFRQRVASKYSGLTDIAAHAKQVGNVSPEGYWRLMSASEQGEDPNIIQQVLGPLPPSEPMGDPLARFLTGPFIQPIPPAEWAAERARQVPIVGAPVARTLEIAGTPATWASVLVPGVGFGATGARIAAESVVGAGIAGGIAEEVGAPPEVQMAAELAGGFAGPALTRAPGLIGRRLATAPEELAPAARAPAVPEAMPAARIPGAMPEAVPAEAVAIPPIGGGDPTARLVELINNAKRIEKQTRVLRAEEMRRRAGAVGGVVEAGQAGKYAPRETGRVALGQLRGELPTAAFEAPELGLRQEEVTDLFKMLVDYDWGAKPLDYPKGYVALEKVLSGQIPQRAEIKLLERVFGPELSTALVGKRPLSAKIWRNVVELLNTPRAVMASADFSATLRQAGIFIRHPKELFGNIPTQFRAFFSEKVAGQVDEMLRKVPAGLYDDDAIQGWNAVFHAERGTAGSLIAREEVWISGLLHKIPVLGQLTKASERGYVTFLNKLRKDIYYNIARKWQGQGKTLNDYMELADLINKGSGRGSLGPLNRASPLLSAGFFAPRFALSRFQYPLKLFSTSPAVRRLAAEEMASFIGAGATMLGFLKFSGLADVELDPRSTDFGKIRIGKTRIDFWAGWQPIVRYAAQIATGDRKASSGFVYDADRLTSIGRFVQGKLSPQAGFAIDVLRNQTFLGEELMPATPSMIRAQVFNRLAPIFIQDVVDAMRGEGLLGGLLAAPAILGVGVQTYQTPYDRMTAARAEVMAQMGVTEEERQANPAVRAQVDAAPEVQALRKELDADLKLHGGPPEARAAALRREVRGLQMSDQAKDDARLDSGAMDIDVWRARADDRSAATYQRVQGIYQALDIVFEEENYAPGSIGQAIQAYYNVKVEDYTSEDTGLVDWDGFYAARDAALAVLPGAEQQQAIGYIQQYWTPKQKEIWQQEQQLQDYFNIPDTVYEANKQRLGLAAPSYSTYRTQAMEDAKANAAAQGLGPEYAANTRFWPPEYRRLQELIERERTVYRRRNPDKTKLLIELGYKPPSQADIARGRGTVAPTLGLEPVTIGTGGLALPTFTP